MKTAVQIWCLAVLVAVTASAQAIKPRMPFRVQADLARFRGPDDSTVNLELYYAVSQAALSYRQDSAGYSAGIHLTVQLYGSDSLVFMDRWMVPSTITDTATLSRGMNLVGAFPVVIRRGDYVLKIMARDRFDTARRDSLQLRLPIRPVVTGKTMLSDLEFASLIRQSQNHTSFYKNTLEVIPNIGGVYSEQQPCFYYAEAYNLLAGKDTGSYVVKAAIYDAIGREILTRERPRRRIAESTVLIDQFPLQAMHSGTYQMVLSVLDSSKKTLTSSSRKFYVLNTSLGVDSALLAGSSSPPLAIYASMDETDLDEEFRQVRYETNDEERAQFGKLSGAEAKRKFMSAFWRKRSTGLRDEYMARVQYSNQNFATMGRKGYRSDRGRVYITYGRPDDIERHPSESDRRPYEIWSYNSIQGGVIFVFVQRNATGDYELVHSTHRNELHDENWQRYVSPQ